MVKTLVSPINTEILGYLRCINVNVVLKFFLSV